MTFDPRLQLDLQLKDVRRLTRKDMETDHYLWRFDGNWQGNDAFQGMRYMRDMGLGMYEWHGYHLIGFTDGGQHPHDRWLYRTSVPIGAKAFDEPRDTSEPRRFPKWLRLRDECSSDTLTVQRDVANLASDMQLLLSAIRFARQSAGMPFGDEVSTARHLQLVGSRKFIELKQQLALRDRQARRLAHEMLHHYEQWLAKNPQAAGMPKDIVFRMYGLGSVVESGLLG